MLANYKTDLCKRPPRLCRQGYACPSYHNSRDRRRSPKKFKYRFVKKKCSLHSGDLFFHFRRSNGFFIIFVQICVCCYVAFKLEICRNGNMFVFNRSTPCPNVKHGDDWGDPTQCEQGDNCPYCHTRTEQQFHPEVICIYIR